MSDLLKTEVMPSLIVQGEMVNIKEHVEKGTKPSSFFGKFLVICLLLLFTICTFGVGLIIVWVADHFTRKRAMGMIRGSGIKVGPNQFPEIYKCVNEFSERLEMKTAPEVYIVEDNVINAAAVKLGGRGVILLVDDIVDACLRSKDVKTLSFILGHEIAHHAYGHVGLVRNLVSKAYKKLARLDEFSCDKVAKELVVSSETALEALTILLVGPQLMQFVNFDELARQAQKVNRDKNSVKAEKALTHPLLLRRIARFIR